MNRDGADNTRDLWTEATWFWAYVRWLLDRDPEYAKKMIERLKAAGRVEDTPHE